jgi:hypothetical protein
MASSSDALNKNIIPAHPSSIAHRQGFVHGFHCIVTQISPQPAFHIFVFPRMLFMRIYRSGTR